MADGLDWAFQLRATRARTKRDAAARDARNESCGFGFFPHPGPKWHSLDFGFPARSYGFSLSFFVKISRVVKPPISNQNCWSCFFVVYSEQGRFFTGQSIDSYSSVTHPNIGFLSGTPGAVSRVGSSFLTSSFQGKHTPDINSSLIKPLLPTTSEPPERTSSHSLLPPLAPTRWQSAKKLPDDHKPPELAAPRQCSFAQGVLNGINLLCGLGILSTPYALKEGGWIGLLILGVFAILAWYTGILLRTCMESEPGLESYTDIGQAAFGTKGRFVISVVLYLELYVSCVEYLILESDNLSSLFPGAHINFSVFHLNSHVLFAILTTLVVLPTTWLRDLSLLSYISAGGVFSSVLVVCCLAWVGVVDGVGFQNKGTALNLPTLPIAVGLYGYCYSGHAVFPNIYISLKNPSHYPSVLFACFTICTVMFGGVAIMGYMMFGDSTESQFTLNLPHEFVASKIAIWTTVVNPITKFALTLTPLALGMEELIPSNYRMTRMYSVATRSALTFSVLLVALWVPFFGLVMSLVGSLFTMLVTFIFPCMCFLSILRGKVTWPQVLLCGFIIAVGIVSCIIGSLSSLSAIIDKLLHRF